MCLRRVCQRPPVRPRLVHETSSVSVLCSPPSDLCGMCCFLFGSVLPVDVCGAVAPVLVSNGFMV